MIIAKVYGPPAYEFLVVANSEEEAYDLVEAEILRQTYYTTEELKGEITFSDKVYISYDEVEINTPTLIELCY